MPNDDKIQILSRCSAETYNGLFRRRFIDYGQKQEIIEYFLNALKKQCDKENFPNQWEPENEQRLADLLSRLNFEPSPTADSSGTDGRGRANRGAPKRPTKPTHSEGNA